MADWRLGHAVVHCPNMPAADNRPIIGIEASRAAVLNRTGVEQYAFNVIQELKGIIPSEYRVVLYSPEPLTGELANLPPGWENRVLRWPPRRLWTQLRLSWEMLRCPPDLLFVPAHALPLVLPRRAVTTMHDVAFMPHPDVYTIQSNLYLRLDAWLALRRAKVLTVSEFSKSEIVRYFRAAADRISVTQLGIDQTRYQPQPSEVVARVREKYGIGEKYFVYVGRLEWKKNTAGMLRAFAAFKAARPAGDETQLVLVGRPGRGYASEMRVIAGDPAAAFVRELGYTDDADVPALYAGAIGTLLVSWYEGFGLPVVESYGCGTPAIVSDRTSLPEVAGDGALYADPTDPEAVATAMARLIDEPELRTRLAAAAMVRSKKFSWKECAQGAWTAIERELRRK